MFGVGGGGGGGVTVIYYFDSLVWPIKWVATSIPVGQSDGVERRRVANITQSKMWFKPYGTNMGQFSQDGNLNLQMSLFGY